MREHDLRNVNRQAGTTTTSVIAKEDHRCRTPSLAYRYMYGHSLSHIRGSDEELQYSHHIFYVDVAKVKIRGVSGNNSEEKPSVLQVSPPWDEDLDNIKT